MTNTNHEIDDSIPSESLAPSQRFAPFKSGKFVVGLTGGIGSGKTAATDWFTSKNIVVVDADVIAHQITQKGSPTLHRLIDVFGEWVVDNNGEMNRQAVRQYVFANDNALLRLEEITHPAIRQQIEQALLSATSPYVILSAPLLLESAEAGLVKLCDRVLVVDVAKEIQAKRASLRDGQNIEQIEAVMSNQLSREERLKHADDVISNEGSLDTLYNKLEDLHRNYLILSEDKVV